MTGHNPLVSQHFKTRGGVIAKITIDMLFCVLDFIDPPPCFAPLRNQNCIQVFSKVVLPPPPWPCCWPQENMGGGEEGLRIWIDCLEQTPPERRRHFVVCCFHSWTRYSIIRLFDFTARVRIFSPRQGDAIIFFNCEWPKAVRSTKEHGLYTFQIVARQRLQDSV